MKAQAVSEKISRTFEVMSSKFQDNFIILWLLTKNTLTVVVMALFILSPMMMLPFLMGWPVPYCYIAYAIWIAWLGGSCLLAAIIGYLRETKTT